MTIDTEALAALIRPSRTVLFLGAGAGVPSGAPTGRELATRLCDRLASGARISEDLTEVCSILENRYGRPALVTAVRSVFEHIQPSGGLLTLPEFDWHAIYTTNFDQLLESAYRRRGKNLTPIRSNFDYGRSEASEGIPLFKLHGCISQDLIDGSKARMVLTERDYEEYEDFREVLYRRLELDLLTKDVLVIGHSLSDSHLRLEMNEAAKLHQQMKGVHGRLYALVHDSDPDRARLLEDKGFTVAFRGIEEFLFALTSAHPETPGIQIGLPTGFDLPPLLRTSTTYVTHALALRANAARLFNGSSATYADIANGLTIRRSLEQQLLDPLVQGKKKFLSIIGAAGVGKTTLARRILTTLTTDHGLLGWEHRADFPFKSGEWLEVERQLRENGLRGALLVDECSDALRQVNILAENLGKLEKSALIVLLTANISQWVPRAKTPEIFGQGMAEKLSDLTGEDINQLVNLIGAQSAIRELVEPHFSRLSRQEQVQQLRNRCSADMYVCLKNIFATEALDTILLREYSELSANLQDIYRHVAALEASGARVHRQLIIRVLNVQADKVSALLSLLEGLVEEYDINPDDGLYGWATRHPVIAQTISRYKFSDRAELHSLFNRVIDGLNPTLSIELRTIRGICDIEYGIGSLADDAREVELYERLIKLVPGERIPRHRLIGKLLYLGQLESAGQAIRAAEDSVGLDSPINRYKVRLALRRAETTEGIMEEDRRAMLNEARRLALDGLRRLPLDKYAYMAYGEAGLAIAQRMGDTSTLDDAIARTTAAVDKILDPHLSDSLRSLERERRRFARPP